ncbi:MAG: RidA family protein [Pseudomonadota bacterium]
MARIEARLEELGLVLPEPPKMPPNVRLPFAMVNVRGNVAYVAGHGPQNEDGSFSEITGKVGNEVSVDDAYVLARKTGLSMLASLKRTLGDLDRVSGWGRIFGMVNSAPGFGDQPAVINGCSDLIHEVFGADIGCHARSAVGMAELPFGIAVEIEADVLIE